MACLPRQQDDAHKNSPAFHQTTYPDETRRTPTERPSELPTFRSWVVLLHGDERVILTRGRRRLKKRFLRRQRGGLLVRCWQRFFIQPGACQKQKCHRSHRQPRSKLRYCQPCSPYVRQFPLTRGNGCHNPRRKPRPCFPAIRGHSFEDFPGREKILRRFLAAAAGCEVVALLHG